MAQAPSSTKPADLTVGVLHADKVVVAGETTTTTIFPGVVAVEGGDKAKGSSVRLSTIRQGESAYSQLSLHRWEAADKTSTVLIDANVDTTITMSTARGGEGRAPDVRLSTGGPGAGDRASVSVQDGPYQARLKSTLFADRLELPTARK
jgi:hypothetical protein